LVALNVGWVLTMLPLGIFGMAVGSAALPALSALAARGELSALGITARRTLGGILFMVVPAALVLIGARLPLVQTIYERGEFTTEASARAATALAFYAAGLPAHGALEIITRTFYALKDTRTPVAIGVAAMALNVGLAYAGAPQLGYVAIPLALSACTILETVVLWLVLQRRLHSLGGSEFFLSIGRTALAGAGLLAVLVPVLAAARSAGLPPLFQSVLGVGTAGLAYLLLAFVTRSPDLQSMLGLVRARFRR
jgi:putative peptidoglycan lipid II flippase